MSAYSDSVAVEQKSDLFGVSSWAHFEQSKQEPIYRYLLGRSWRTPAPDQRMVLWIMLNPSTATAHADDNTIRKVVAFSKTWGFDRLVVVNLFALRSTDPAGLLDVRDPVGPLNDLAIAEAAVGAHQIVCAWGLGHDAPRARVKRRERENRVCEILAGRDLLCLGTTEAEGAPKHPLYLPGHLEPRVWRSGE